MSTRSLLPMHQRSPNGIIISGPSGKSVLRSNEKILFFCAIIAFTVFCFLGLYMLPDMKPGRMIEYLSADQLGPNLLGLPNNDVGSGVLPRPQSRDEDTQRLREKIQQQESNDQHYAVIPKPHEVPASHNSFLSISEADKKIEDDISNDIGVIQKPKRSGFYRNWTPETLGAGIDSDPEVAKRQAHIKMMMINSWDEYKRYAWGENELRPNSKIGHSAGIFGSSKLGATIVDSLDTLWIMGLKDRFKDGRDWIAKYFDISQVKTKMSVFETIIRFVGGFLTCYSLTGDEMFLNKSIEVADRMLPAFNTATGIPLSLVNPASGSSQNYDWASQGLSILSEIGTLYLEFSYLSAVTGNPIYLEKVENIRKILDEAPKKDGLYPNFISPETGKWGKVHVSLGALGDSFYEYLLKTWIMSGKTDDMALRMYTDAIDAVDKKLVRSSKNGLKYVADLQYSRLEHKMGHLACFTAGMFSLGANLSMHSTPERNAHFMKLGEDIGHTCHESYRRTETGIGPEIFWFTGDLEAQPLRQQDEYYILRPEVVEGWFYLWRLTHDNKYREWAWEAVLSLEKYCLVSENGAYSGIRHVNNKASPDKDDVQQSFCWVFNTEAHPLPIRGKNPAFPPVSK